MYFLPVFQEIKLGTICMSPLWMENFATIRNVQKLKDYYRDSGFKMFRF